MLSVLAINTVITIWEHHKARALDSVLLHADATHTMSDVLITAIAIVGWQIAARGYLWVDTLLALVVAGLVFYLAYGLFARAIPVLVDAAIVEGHHLMQRAEAVPGVREVSQLRSHRAGSGSIVDVTVRVDPELTTLDSHRIADAVEEVVRNEVQAKRLEVIVHVEPEAAPET